MVWPAGVLDHLHSHGVTVGSPVFGGFVLEYGMFVWVEKIISVSIFSCIIHWFTGGRSVQSMQCWDVLSLWIVWGSEWMLVMETNYKVSMVLSLSFFFLFLHKREWVKHMHSYRKLPSTDFLQFWLPVSILKMAKLHKKMSDYIQKTNSFVQYLLSIV